MRRAGLAFVVLVAGCGPPPGARGPAGAEPHEPVADFRGGGDAGAKIHPKLLRDWQTGIPQRFELVLVVDVVSAEADAARLLAMGAHAVRPVAVTERGPYGVATATLVEGAESAWLVHAPVEILVYLIQVPWVRGVALATTWSYGLDLPAEVDRRLDPRLRGALVTFGEQRQFAIGGLGKTSGCLDDARRRELAALGAVIMTVIDARDCASSIFTFEVPLGSLVALAALPWIVRLEGSRPMYPENAEDE
jgi:hypothetical protein